MPHHVSIWVIIRQLELEDWDTAAVAEFYEIPAEAVDAAITYYRKHQAVIDKRIARNRAYFAAL